MKRIIILFAVSALAQAPPLPDKLLAEYWRAVAARQAQMAALQASLTAQQKQLQEAIAAADKQIEDVRVRLRAACPEGFVLAEEADPVCQAKKP